MSFCCFRISESRERIYFLLHSECTNQFSCVGDVHDVSVVCISSRCVCDPRLGVYDPIRYQCVGRADHACLNEYCTRNSVCDSKTNTCKCHEGYEMDPEGLCVHKHGEFCTENEDCKDTLLCYSEKCECQYPTHQYYNAENDTCYSFAESWDATLRNNNDGNQASSVFRCLEMLFVMAQVGCLVAIAFILGKIGMALREAVGTFKLHGYFLRSGLESKIQEGSSIQIESASFFDGGKD